MDIFDLADLLAAQNQSNERYFEFLRQPSLSLGVYRLPTGRVDPQSPHTEDEVYYVISGRASIRVGDEDRAVGQGSIVFVAANVKHYFHSIDEDLVVLVFFAPAEYSQA